MLEIRSLSPPGRLPFLGRPGLAAGKSSPTPCGGVRRGSVFGVLCAMRMRHTRHAMVVLGCENLTI